FLPALNRHLVHPPRVCVVGSAPPREVERLCTEHRWELYPDVSDERLRALYAEATCAILPFSYATGAKLKLLGALGHGVPYVATPAVAGQVEVPPRSCLISADPEAWARHVEGLAGGGLDMDLRQALLREAERYSWPTVVAHMLESLSASSAR
ncbi:MAG: glycosyltransferase family 4 protein, partial [Bacteroidota bacterium]